MHRAIIRKNGHGIGGHRRIAHAQIAGERQVAGAIDEQEAILVDPDSLARTAAIGGSDPHRPGTDRQQHAHVRL